MKIWNKINTGQPDLTDNARASIDLIADRIDNLEKGLAGDDNLTTIDINGGTIDGTPIGANSAVAGSFTDIVGTKINIDNIEINGNTISSTDTNGNITLAPNGLGLVDGNVFVCDSININSSLTLKCAIVTSPQFDINGSGTYNYTITHGKGDKLRGALPPFYTCTTSAGMTGITSLRLVSHSETVLNIEVVAVGDIDPATVSCVIFYID